MSRAQGWGGGGGARGRLGQGGRGERPAGAGGARSRLGLGGGARGRVLQGKLVLGSSNTSDGGDLVWHVIYAPM